MSRAKQLSISVAVAAGLGLAQVGHAAEGVIPERFQLLRESRLSLAVGAEYTTGNYGTGSTTDVLYVPVTARLDSGRNAFKLTVPWISVTTETSGGTIVGMDPMGRPMRRGGVRQRTTESGLGDVIASYGRNLFEDAPSGTYLDAVAKVKFGTADETRGLGTGENDYSLQADAYRTVSAVTLLATVGYKVIGDPPGTNFNNIYFATLGASTRYGEEGSAGLLYDYRQATLASTDPQRELTIYARGGVGRSSALQLYALKGFSNASPDWGVGASLFVGF